MKQVWSTLCSLLLGYAVGRAKNIADNDVLKGKRFRVFISHSSKDAEVARLFCSYLEAAYQISQNDIFCTSKVDNGLKNDSYFFPRIQAALKQSEVIIYLVSDKFLSSKDCLMELGMGYYNQNTIRCTFLMGSATQDDLPGMLLGRQNLGNIEMPGALSSLKSEISEIIKSKRDEGIEWDKLATDFLTKARPHILASQKSQDVHSENDVNLPFRPESTLVAENSENEEALGSAECGRYHNAVEMTIGFRRFLIQSEPDLHFIQHYDKGIDIKSFLAKLKNYKTSNLWHLWNVNCTMHFYPNKMDVSDFPFVRFAENCFKIAEMWLICDRACSQCDDDFILIRYEKYALPHSSDIEYWYNNKLIPETQAINGYVKTGDGKIEKIDSDKYREIVHNNQDDFLLIGPRLGCFAEASDRDPRETAKLLQKLRKNARNISNEDIAKLCCFFRKFHNKDVMATA